MKCESANRRFQPGEGPSRGLLRDCTTSPINRLQHKNSFTECFFSVNTFDGPITLRTKSRGLDTNILVLKTWIFGHKGATVVSINVQIMDFLLYSATVVCIKHFIISEMLSRTKSWRYYPNSLWREFTKKTFLNRSFVLYWILSWKVCVNCK